MAQTEVSILVNVVDKASEAFKGIGGSIDNLQKKMTPAFKTMAVAGGAAFGAISLAVKGSITAFGEAERYQRQLNHAMIDLSGATEDQVAKVNELTKALQKKAGIDGDALTAGVAQLSTFGLQTESVVNLTKSLADLTVNQAGVNASADEYIQNANVIAKALNGQFGVLEKSGIRFTELQQNMILYGTEAEKVKALQEGLNQNLRETTDTLGGVDGATARLSRSMGEIQESIGAALAPALENLLAKLQPLIDKIAEWAAANPDLVSKLIIVAGAATALIAVLGTIGLILPAIIVGVKLLAAVFLAIVSPIGLFVIAIGAAIFAGYAIAQNWETIKAKAIEIWTSVSAFFTEIWTGIVILWQTQTEIIATSWSNFWGSVYELTTKGKEKLDKAWTAMWTGIGNTVTSVFEGIQNVIKNSINWIISKINFFIDAANRISEAGSKVPGVNIPKIDRIPMLAKGGIVKSPTLAMIGEAGPEAVIPLSGRNRGIGGNITINITGNTLLDMAAGEKIGDQIIKKLMLTQRLAA